jgi:hypothetical protein
MRLFHSAAAGALLACAVSVAAHADTFTYNDFSSTSGLTLVGATAPAGSPAVLRLVPAQTGKAGAAYNTSAFTLGSNDTFSTQFQFRMSNPGGVDPADGLVFVLTADPSGLGTAGFGIGYSGSSSKSLGIEFDTFYDGPGSIATNGGGGANDDLDKNNLSSSNHVAIDTSGILTNSDMADVYGIRSCGFTTGSPPQSPNTVAGCMSNGDIWTANISYDGSNLTVQHRDPAEGSTFTAISNLPIDIASYLGTNQAFVGFTSGTGAGDEDTDILNWKFANTTEITLPPGVPEPATWGLMLLGFGGIGMAMRRRRRPALAQVA